MVGCDVGPTSLWGEPSEGIERGRPHILLKGVEATFLSDRFEPRRETSPYGVVQVQVWTIVIDGRGEAEWVNWIGYILEMADDGRRMAENDKMT